MISVVVHMLHAPTDNGKH